MTNQNARDRMQQRRSQKRRQTQSVLIIVVAVLALAVVGVLIALNTQPPPTPPSGDYQGIPQSIDRTSATGLVIGQPNAPVTLTEYSDFSCPHCRDLEPTILKLITDYAKLGSLKIIYKPVTFVGAGYSEAAARGAICAAEQGKFWQMQEQIWKLFDSSGAGAYSESAMTSLAGQIGVDAGKFGSCYGSASTTSDIQSVATEVQAIGVNGTPTLYLDGQRLDFTGPDSLIQAVKQKVAAAPTAAPAIAPASPTP